MVMVICVIDKPSEWLKLPRLRKYFHGSKDVRVVEVLLHVELS